MELTHASFFSGVGGMDIGLERAGWQTVSLSEIDAYASAVLAERWPGVPNLGDIAAVDDGEWARATLWSGGFPCQDLSVAGKRSGFGGERSVLAFTFLDLVERHRPRAFILENVPGLLSSNAGRDFGRLLREVGDLGYWWAYRVLDAQWFGVPQRRRRVFILAIDSRRYPDPDGPAEVLAVGTSCGRDHQAERASWADAPCGSRPGAAGAGWNAAAQFGRWVDADGVTQTLATKDYKSSNTIVSPTLRAGRHGEPGIGRDNDHERLVVLGDSSPDAGRVRAADGLAGRVDDREVLADSGVVTALTKGLGSGGPDAAHAQAGWLVCGEAGRDDELLPVGMDSHRYRAIGNGVAAPVAEWIGRRLAEWFRA